MESLSALPLGVVLVAVLVAAGTDLWSFRIHNALTFPLVLSGVLYHSATAGASGFAECVLGAMIAVGPLLIPYFAGGMGAGDLKLMAGVGVWLGPWAALHVLIVSGLSMGLCSAALLIWERNGTWSRAEIPLGATLPSAAEVPALQAALGRRDRRRKVIPFGLLIALGVIATAVWLGGSI
ncbi:MAG TPA: A24 family peptidase [Pirellulaceae bacterium]|nr:A24 family peptidase [Pirellulaceae bacterium]